MADIYSMSEEKILTRLQKSSLISASKSSQTLNADSQQQNAPLTTQISHKRSATDTDIFQLKNHHQGQRQQQLLGEDFSEENGTSSYDESEEDLEDYCSVCEKNFSKEGNVLVFCDACNVCFHQLCSRIPIPEIFVLNRNILWYCPDCTQKLPQPKVPTRCICNVRKPIGKMISCSICDNSMHRICLGNKASSSSSLDESFVCPICLVTQHIFEEANSMTDPPKSTQTKLSTATTTVSDHLQSFAAVPSVEVATIESQVKALAAENKLPLAVEERSISILLECLSKKLLRGQNMFSMIVAAVFISCRKEEFPMTFQEMSKATGILKSTIGKNTKIILKALDATMESIPTEMYIEKYCKELGIVENVNFIVPHIQHFASVACDVSGVGGRCPLSIIATSLFVVVLAMNLYLTATATTPSSMAIQPPNNNSTISSEANAESIETNSSSSSSILLAFSRSFKKKVSNSVGISETSINTTLRHLTPQLHRLFRTDFPSLKILHLIPAYL